MKYQSYLLVIVLWLSMSGCALLKTSTKNVDDNFNQLVRENEFVSAIDYLDELSESLYSSKKLKKKRNSMIKPMRSYEEQSLGKIRSFVEQENWKAAIDVFDDVLPRLPKGSVVYKEYDSFNKLKQRHIYELEIQVLITKANSLEDILKVRQSISELDPYSYIKKIKLSLLKSELEDVAEELFEYGLKAIEDSHYSIAKRTLPLALRIYQSKEIQLANKRLEIIFESMQKSIQNLTDSGTELYGKERYEDAVFIWQQVLLLDPENKDVKISLERAKRVIESLQRLKKESIVSLDS